MQFGYDALGHLTRMIRKDVAHPPASVTTTWHYDNLDQVIGLEEPDGAPQFRSYDRWGALLSTQWCDATISSCSAGTINRRTDYRYDARGRLMHSEEKTNSVVIGETVKDFVYDQGVNTTTPPVTAANVLGRLAKATAPTSSVSFSYDAFGRVNAQVFTDRTATSSNVYVQKHDYHGDGSLQTLHLLLPDNAFKDEKTDYTYDSAGRTRSVTYNNGTSHNLFAASGSTDIYDVFGRIRKAQYAAATYTATYADTGRRLLTDVTVATPGGGGTREISFLPVPGTSGSITAFDPLGRERVRTEIQAGHTQPAIVSEYDALGRLTNTSGLSNSTVSPLRSFTYDSLGNILTQADLSAPNKIGANMLTYQSPDRDRICSIAYGTATPPATCNVTYDGVGNIVSQPDRNNHLRTFTYLPSGQVATIVRGDTTATFDYDAFGGVQRLVLNSPSAADTRNDKHFGLLIYRRDEMVAGIRRSVINRSIPGPGGLVATRHGSGQNDPWTFTFGETRGSRFVTDRNGAVTQDLSYQQYGEVASNGAQPGSQAYENAQWNGRDALAALGLSQLGARIYDPVIGRFLSRDPLIIPRTAATTNPYAFASNDPVNRSDPSGLFHGDERPYDGPTCIGIFCFGGGSGGGGGGGGGGGHSSEPREPHTSITSSGGTPLQAPPIVKTPQTREGRALRRIMMESQKLGGDSLDWDALAAMKLDYKDMVERISQHQGTYVDPHDPWNVTVDAVHGIVQLGLTVIPLERPAAAIVTAGKGAARYVGRGLSGLSRPARPGITAACRSGVCSGPVCFVAGTAVATPNGEVPIETIRPGDRVEAGNPRCADEHLAEDTVTIVLEVTNPSRPDEKAHVELARPLHWLEESGLVDGEGPIEMEEIGLSGWAQVTYVGPAPPAQPGEGCLVLMTVNHIAQEVLALRFETGTQLKVTPTHPLYVEGSGWTPAGRLNAGQLLRTDNGSLEIESVVRAKPNQRVYNIEVGLEHTYRVSRDAIWAHNNCGIDGLILTDKLLELGTHHRAFKDLLPAQMFGNTPSGLPKVLNLIDTSGIIQVSTRTGGYRRLTASELAEVNRLRRDIAASRRARGEPVPGYLEPPPDR